MIYVLPLKKLTLKKLIQITTLCNEKFLPPNLYLTLNNPDIKKPIWLAYHSCEFYKYNDTRTINGSEWYDENDRESGHKKDFQYGMGH